MQNVDFWEMADLVRALGRLPKEKTVWFGVNSADGLFSISVEGTDFALWNMPASVDNLTMARLRIESLARKGKK